MRATATARTRPSRHRERVSYDLALVHAILDEALVCHLGFLVDGRPVVLPTIHARVANTLYLHGSSGARLLRTAAEAPVPVCVTVTLLDGLVLARSQFNHSLNYRSVVVHGDARLVEEEAEQRAVLRALVEHVVPGRAEASRSPTAKELAATTVLALPLTEVSAKVRSGPPKDDADEPDSGWWAGVLPAALTFGPAPPGAPEQLRDYRRPTQPLL